ncbi:MAG TPA: methyltransferase domain-containing protein [Bryobacteraceae bacterium]|nr:methyltransferase domain-containing protein [Bryobacteraceae bacterium]
MKRAEEKEILDGAGVSDALAHQAYGQLTRIHRYLGDTACIVKAIRRDPLPVRRVLDVGCATGGVLGEIRQKLGVEAVGVDVVPRGTGDARFPIIRADAVRDPLPKADLAFSMYLGHHLSEQDVIRLIRNVGRFARRFLLLDLVRHPLPLALFRTFVAPFVSPVVVADGAVSIRRSYTRSEMGKLTAEALAGSGGRFRHSVAPLYMRQVIDISYGGEA